MGYQQQVWAVMAKKGKRGRWRLRYLAATRRNAKSLAGGLQIDGLATRVTAIDTAIRAEALKVLLI